MPVRACVDQDRRPEVRLVLPVNAVVLPNVEMQVLDVIFPTRPDHLQAQANGKSSFKVDVLTTR